MRNRISRYDRAEWIMLLARCRLATPQDIAAARRDEAKGWRKRRKPRRGREEECDGTPPESQ